MNWFSRLFESDHAYNQRHLKHIDDYAALTVRCLADCRPEDADLVPIYQEALRLWGKARDLVTNGHGDLADGIKQVAQELHEEALMTSTRRLQARLKEDGRLLREQIAVLDARIAADKLRLGGNDGKAE